MEVIEIILIKNKLWFKKNNNAIYVLLKNYSIMFLRDKKSVWILLDNLLFAQNKQNLFEVLSGFSNDGRIWIYSLFWIHFNSKKNLDFLCTIIKSEFEN